MRVYKYCNAKGILILQNQCIKFLDVTATNDPFECRPFICDSPKEIERLKNEFYKRACNFGSVALCIAKGRGLSNYKIHRMKQTEIKKVLAKERLQSWFRIPEETYFLLSLTRKEKCPLMWSHYADEHKGLLIELETEGLFRHESDDTRLWNMNLCEVKYSQNRPMLTLSDPKPETWLVKDNCWAYENEWRIFALNHLLKYIEKDKIYVLDLLPSTIRSVTLGFRAGEELKNAVKTLKANPDFKHVEFLKCELDEKHFEFKYTPAF